MTEEQARMVREAAEEIRQRWNEFTTPEQIDEVIARHFVQIITEEK